MLVFIQKFKGIRTEHTTIPVTVLLCGSPLSTWCRIIRTERHKMCSIETTPSHVCKLSKWRWAPDVQSFNNFQTFHKIRMFINAFTRAHPVRPTNKQGRHPVEEVMLIRTAMNRETELGITPI
jgi:hypothetical protein